MNMAALRHNLILALACVSALIYGITCKPDKRSATDCYGTDCIITVQDELDYRGNPRDTVLLENITGSLNHAFPEIADMLKNIVYIHQNATATALSSIAQSLDDDKHLQASQNVLIENGTAVTTPILLEMVRLMQNQQAMQERVNQETQSQEKRQWKLLQNITETATATLTTLKRVADLLEDQAEKPDQDSVSSIAPLPTAVHQRENTPYSCLGLSSGEHTILPNNTVLGSFPVVCDMDTDGGGWIVFQRRFNGSTDFDRTWDDYETGFGSLDGEFWLGLQKLHVLTSRGRWELRVDLGDFYGNRAYAIYEDFKIEDGVYRLNIGSYSGTAGDSFNVGAAYSLNGMAFTTKDEDHDLRKYGSCAIVNRGAWWYRACGSANLNGMYMGLTGWQSMSWYNWKNEWEPLKESELKIRRTDG